LVDDNRETLTDLLDCPCLGEIEFLEALQHKGPLSQDQKKILSAPLKKSLEKLMQIK
jgi:hypothetical protein